MMVTSMKFSSKILAYLAQKTDGLIAGASVALWVLHVEIQWCGPPFKFVADHRHEIDHADKPARSLKEGLTTGKTPPAEEVV